MRTITDHGFIELTFNGVGDVSAMASAGMRLQLAHRLSSVWFSGVSTDDTDSAHRRPGETITSPPERERIEKKRKRGKKKTRDGEEEVKEEEGRIKKMNTTQTTPISFRLEFEKP